MVPPMLAGMNRLLHRVIGLMRISMADPFDPFFPEAETSFV